MIVRNANALGDYRKAFDLVIIVRVICSSYIEWFSSQSGSSRRNHGGIDTAQRNSRSGDTLSEVVPDNYGSTGKKTSRAREKDGTTGQPAPKTTSIKKKKRQNGQKEKERKHKRESKHTRANLNLQNQYTYCVHRQTSLPSRAEMREKNPGGWDNTLEKKTSIAKKRRETERERQRKKTPKPKTASCGDKCGRGQARWKKQVSKQVYFFVIARSSCVSGTPPPYLAMIV